MIRRLLASRWVRASVVLWVVLALVHTGRSLYAAGEVSGAMQANREWLPVVTTRPARWHDGFTVGTWLLIGWIVVAAAVCVLEAGFYLGVALGWWGS